MKPDFQYIKIPLVLSILAFSFGAIIFYTSRWHEEESLKKYYLVEREFNQAKRQYEEANRNRSLYEQYLANYLDLLEQGIIGEEQRLNWIELLQNIDKELTLPSLLYDIDVKKVSTLPGVNAGQNIVVYKSEMGIKFEVLHEADLFYLFNELRDKAKGFYALNQCEVIAKMGSKGPRFSPGQGNLSADCKLSWVTVMVNG